MRYNGSKEIIAVGDLVFVEGDVEGRVVCDYDQQKCLEGYESWLFEGELVRGGRLDHGVMIETEALGFIHYAEPDTTILKRTEPKA